MLRRSSRAVLAVALVVMLAACVETTRIPAADPSPSAAPLFASDDEALAAAVEAYEAYLVISSQTANDPDFDREPLRRITTEDYFEELVLSATELHDQGLRTEGLIRLQRAHLQQVVVDNSTNTTVIIYACIDVSGVRLVDLGGMDKTPLDRSVLVPLEVELRAAGPSTPPHLLVASSQSWPDESACNP